MDNAFHPSPGTLLVIDYANAVFDVPEPDWSGNALLVTGQESSALQVAADQRCLVIESPDRLSSDDHAAVRVLTASGHVGWTWVCWTREL